MKRVFVFCFSLFVPIFSAFAETTPVQRALAEAYYSVHGENQREQGRGINICNLLISSTDASPIQKSEAYFILAYGKFHQQKDPDGIQFYEDCAKLNPLHLENLVSLADAHLQLLVQNDVEALGPSLEPSQEDSRRGLLAFRHRSEAIRRYTEITELDKSLLSPDDRRVFPLYQSKAMIRLGDLQLDREQAGQYYQRASKIAQEFSAEEKEESQKDILELALFASPSENIKEVADWINLENENLAPLAQPKEFEALIKWVRSSSELDMLPKLPCCVRAASLTEVGPQFAYKGNQIQAQLCYAMIQNAESEKILTDTMKNVEKLPNQRWHAEALFTRSKYLLRKRKLGEVVSPQIISDAQQALQILQSLNLDPEDGLDAYFDAYFLTGEISTHFAQVQKLAAAVVAARQNSLQASSRPQSNTSPYRARSSGYHPSSRATTSSSSQDRCFQPHGDAVHRGINNLSPQTSRSEASKSWRK